MLTLKGTNLYLRALEPEDLSFLYDLENNETYWNISETITPYSRHILRKYLDNAHQDIYEVKQLRLAICLMDSTTIGLIDLFDFNPIHKRAGIGIIIKEETQKNKGYGSEALTLLCNYAQKRLHLHQVYANIEKDNESSIKLFESQGFEKVGVKKDWNLVNGEYQDEILYQRRYVH